VIIASCTNVVHAFDDAGERVVALDDVSVELEAGALTLVVGPSGSGKSTLLAALAGLLVPTSGRVTLDGAELRRLDAEGRAAVRRNGVGFVFQSFHLFEALTAQENVECVLALQRLPRAEGAARARAALAQVGLEGCEDRRPSQLSGGQRQRVAVARALAVEPRIIFGDEPTSALDSGSAARVLDALRTFVETGGTVVLATHDPRLRAMAQRIVTLENGRVVADERAAGTG